MIKRGQLVIKAIIVLIVSAVIIFAFPYIGKSFGSGELSKKAIAAREIALLIDTLYIYPYDIVVYYEKDLTGLTIEVSDERVSIYNTMFNRKNLDPAFAEYGFIPTGINKINIKLESPKRIKFEKSKEELIIKKDENNKQ